MSRGQFGCCVLCLASSHKYTILIQRNFIISSSSFSFLFFCFCLFRFYVFICFSFFLYIGCIKEGEKEGNSPWSVCVRLRSDGSILDDDDDVLVLIQSGHSVTAGTVLLFGDLFLSGQHFRGPYLRPLSSVMLWMQSSCINVVVFSLFSSLTLLLCCAVLCREGVETGPVFVRSFLGPVLWSHADRLDWIFSCPFCFVAPSLCLIFWVDGSRMSIFCCYCSFGSFSFLSLLVICLSSSLATIFCHTESGQQLAWCFCSSFCVPFDHCFV